jgi:hypothetical protein
MGLLLVLIFPDSILVQAIAAVACSFGVAVPIHNIVLAHREEKKLSEETEKVRLEEIEIGIQRGSNLWCEL